MSDASRSRTHTYPTSTFGLLGGVLYCRRGSSGSIKGPVVTAPGAGKNLGLLSVPLLGDRLAGATQLFGGVLELGEAVLMGSTVDS